MLADIPVERIRGFEAFLFEHLRVQATGILESIRDTRVLTPENEEALRQTVEVCKARFLG
jgi:F0F1-type ATP synthase alpha subunit